MDINHVFLEGLVGDDFKYMRMRGGQEFATFTLIINSYDRDSHDSSERRSYTYLRLMVFDKKAVEYLRRVHCHGGCRVSVLGRMNSHKVEKRGQEFRQNDVIVRKISVIKTSATQQDKDEPEPIIEEFDAAVDEQNNEQND